LSSDKTAQITALTAPYLKAPDSFESKEEKFYYQMGEALFRSPTLLGGQAAKARISCNSCHLSGKDNSAFQFPNISGAPGTADVSNSFFSSFRGNGEFDPIVIPDLRKKGAISRDPAKEDLKLFIRSLIVEEFNGSEPTPSTLKALTTYVRKIDGLENHIYDNKSLSAHHPINLIDQITSNIIVSLQSEDRHMAELLIEAARHQLGLIYERYQGPDLNRERSAVLKASHKLSKIRAGWRKEINGHDIHTIKIKEWKKRFKKTERILLSNEKKSLFNKDKLNHFVSRE